MLKRWLWRCLIGLCFALPAGFMAAAVAQAGSMIQEGPANECLDCHEIIQSYWAESAHGQAASDQAFNKAWQESGNSSECLSCHTTGYDPVTGSWEADGVTCTVCHSPASADHPEAVMPTDISSRLCGTCHLDTHAEWESSTHGKEELSCVRCHNPHTTKLKKSDTQEVCQACHNNEAHFFTYTGHAKEGLMCADCHLRVSDAQVGEGHGRRVHTFVVDINTCTECHGDNLHYPTGNEGQSAETHDIQMASTIGGSVVSVQPEPVSPVGFAIIAALVGMGSGIVLAPWLENQYRRNRHGDGTR